MRIEIAGVLGTGKTTIASFINPNCVIHEDFNLNPFLSSFYESPSRYAFETEFSFLLQHYHQIKKSALDNKICDFALVQDLAYGKMGTKGQRQQLFIETYTEITSEIDNPDILIFLTCNIDVLLERIKKRGRESEKVIDSTFLLTLQEYISEEIKSISNQKIKIIHVDTSFFNYEKDLSALKELQQLLDIG